MLTQPVWGWTNRKVTNAAYLSDLMALKKALFLCKTCEGRLHPGKKDYRELRRFHASHTQCDGCQEQGDASVWLHESSYYFIEP